jgi:hypothetical protein
MAAGQFNSDLHPMANAPVGTVFGSDQQVGTVPQPKFESKKPDERGRLRQFLSGLVTKHEVTGPNVAIPEPISTGLTPGSPGNEFGVAQVEAQTPMSEVPNVTPAGEGVPLVEPVSTEPPKTPVS